MTLRAGRHTDIGLQPERTLLAWRRTLLSLVAASLLFLRWIPHHGPFAVMMVGLSLLAALGIGLGQQRRYRKGVDALNGQLGPPPLGEVAALALVCVLLGLIGLYVVLFF